MAQQYTPINRSATASVQVGGAVAPIQVFCNPVNYTQISFGIGAGFSVPKRNNCDRDDIMIRLDPSSNNVVWNISINGSDMSDALHKINVSNIQFNSSCAYSGGTPLPLTNLSYGLQYICLNIPYNAVINVSFRLNVPPGQYNNTYSGPIWLYANSSSASTDPKNQTWYGPGNTTVMIERTIDISWNGVPITFPTLASSFPGNATPGSGWPSNITSSSVTNIFIELYLNGTDFNCSSCNNPLAKFPSTWVSYSNATTLNTWPNGTHPLLNTSFYYSSGGDFPNWGNKNFGNSTIKNIWWNITVPPGGQIAGEYQAIVNAKAVDVGQNPNG